MIGKSTLVIQPWISYRGAESVSIEQVKRYNKSGVKSSILCLEVDRKRLKKDDFIDYVIPPKWLRKIIWKNKFSLALFCLPTLFIMTIIYGRKYTDLNPHNFPTLWSSVLANIILNKKITWTVHNFPQIWFEKDWANSLWENLSRPVDLWMSKRADLIIAVSQKVQKQIKARYGLSSKVVYPVVDNDFFSPGGKKDPDLVLIPMKSVSSKNPDIADMVISRVKSLRPNTKFLILGEGSKIGWINKEKLRTYYQKASLVFLPSFWGEGFNVVVLEAFACGTKSLVFKGCGADIWIKKTNSGWVVPIDVDISARTIVKVLNKK